MAVIETINLVPGLLTQHMWLAVLMLVKLIMCNDVPGCWVDVWRSGILLLYSCKAAF